MVNFPIQSLMNYESSYQFLQKLLHPQWLKCICGKSVGDGQFPHKKQSNNLPCFKRKSCGKMFKFFRTTTFRGIHYDCIIIVLNALRICSRKTTQYLSKELSISYNSLLDWRQKLRKYARGDDGMVSTKFIATLAKAYGPDFEIFFDYSEELTKSI